MSRRKPSASLILFLLLGRLSAGILGGQLPAGEGTRNQAEEDIATAQELLQRLRGMSLGEREAFFRDPAQAALREQLVPLTTAVHSLAAGTEALQSHHEALDYLIQWWSAGSGPDHPRVNVYRLLQATAYESYGSDYCRALPYRDAILSSYRRTGNQEGVFPALVDLARTASRCGQEAVAREALQQARSLVGPVSPVTSVEVLYEMLAERLPEGDRTGSGEALERELRTAGEHRQDPAERLRLSFAAHILQSRRLRQEVKLEAAQAALVDAQTASDELADWSAGAAESARLQLLNEAMRLVVQAAVDLGYDDALHAIRAASDAFRRPTDPVDLGGFADQYVVIRMRAAGKYEELLRRFHDQADAAGPGEPIGRAAALWQIGLLYRSLNKTDRAREYLDLAMELTLAETEKAWQGPVLESAAAVPLAAALAQLSARADMDLAEGRLDMAEEALGTAKSILDRLPHMWLELIFPGRREDWILATARLAAERGNAGEAIAAADRLERDTAARGTLKPALAARLETLRALAQEKGGTGEQAAAHLARAADLSGQAGDRNEQMRLLRRLTLFWLERGRLDAAAAAASQLLELARRLWAPPYEWRAAFDLGRIHEVGGERIRAEAFYQSAVRTVELLRAGLSSEDHRAAVLENEEIEELFGRLIQLLLELGKPKEAFETAERDKARTFLETLGAAAARGRVKTGRASPLLEQQTRLRERISVLESALRRSLESTSPQPAMSSQQIQERLEATKKTYVELLDRIKLTEPATAAALSVAPVSLEAVQRRLGLSSALIEFSRVPSGLVRFQVTRDSLGATLLRIEEKELANLLAEFRESLELPGESGRRLWLRTGFRLRELLLGSLDTRVEDALNWILVPHGRLHLVPLSALPLAADGSRVLLDGHTIRYLSSAGVLQLEPGPPGVPAGSAAAQRPSIDTQNDIGRSGMQAVVPPPHALFVALGNLEVPPLGPLPATLQEVGAAAALFPHSLILAETSATKSRLLAQSSHASLIHFATHGVLDEAHPLFSALILAPEPADPSARLTLAEILELSLSAEVVALSACQTAVSQVGRNDELANLARAFLVAGARQVVASLWNVDDESTSRLMQYFYKELSQNAPEEALRRAILSLRPDYPDPLFWAPFLLFGPPASMH